VSTYSCACGRYTATECNATGAACPDCDQKVNATVKDRLTAARNVARRGKPPWRVVHVDQGIFLFDANAEHLGTMVSFNLARAVVDAINSVHSGERLSSPTLDALEARRQSAIIAAAEPTGELPAAKR
jgi:hypothetical protein